MGSKRILSDLSFKKVHEETSGNDSLYQSLYQSLLVQSALVLISHLGQRKAV